jgi:hypothetical protein
MNMTATLAFSIDVHWFQLLEDHNMSKTLLEADQKETNEITWLKPADPTDPKVIKDSIAFECCKDVCLAMSDFEDQD